MPRGAPPAAWPVARHVGGLPDKASERSAGGDRGIDFAWLLHAVLRNWWLVALVGLICTGTAAVVLKSLPDDYTPYTEVIVERDETEFGNLREGLDFAPRGISAAEMETHLRLLGSDNIARSVIERLQLAPERAEPGLVERVLGTLQSLGNALTLRIEALAGDLFSVNGSGGTGSGDMASVTPDPVSPLPMAGPGEPAWLRCSRSSAASSASTGTRWRS